MNMELVLSLVCDPDLWLIKAGVGLPAAISSKVALLHRAKRMAERVPGAHRVYKWATSRTGEGRVYRIKNGPLKGARWRRYNAFPYWYHTGLYEPEISNCIGAHLKKNDTFWDIGAHAGYHTLIAAQAVGPMGRVLAVEPDPHVCDIMREQLELNGIPNATIVAAAVAPKPGEAAFIVRDVDNRTSAMADVHNPAIDNAGGRRIMVRCTTLNLLAREVPKPKVLKMDVEGAEDLILPAAESFFASPDRPRVMILGYHGARTGQNCLRWMRQYGYQIGTAPGLATDAVSTYGTMLWYDRTRLN
jgi:FkbM family methyltransferase